MSYTTGPDDRTIELFPEGMPFRFFCWEARDGEYLPFDRSIALYTATWDKTSIEQVIYVTLCRQSEVLCFAMRRLPSQRAFECAHSNVDDHHYRGHGSPSPRRIDADPPQANL